MMKKFMQLPDAVMRMYYELLTNIPLDEVEQWLAGHPKEAKLRLATEVIDQYHTAGSGTDAGERWQREVGGSDIPDEIPIVNIAATALRDGCLPAATLLKLAGLAASTSEARRTIEQGGAYFGDQLARITDHQQPIAVTDGLLLKLGKKKFIRVELVP
jgi:tyrosyl-tRNA synthetase